MDKKTLIRTIANDAAISQISASLAVNSFADALTSSLKRGEAIILPGIGKLSIKTRPARKGINPRTGEPIAISARASVRFSPAKALKDAVNPPLSG